MLEALMRRSAVTLAIIMLPWAVPAFGLTIQYDASVTPDDPSLQTVFSTTPVGGDTSWTASDGILAMSTADLASIWFGNHPTYDVVPWSLGDSAQGNFMSLVARVGAGASGWYAYIYDGSNSVQLSFASSQVRYMTSTGAMASYSLPGFDPTVFHTYSVLLAGGQATYRIDGAVAYSGAAYAIATDKYLVIGDGSGDPGYGVGTMYLDSLYVETDTTVDPLGQGSEVPEPGSLALVAVGLAGAFFKLRPRRAG